MPIFEELKRRNVIRVAALYVVASWLIMQVADLLLDAFDIPSSAMRLLVVILLLGFPLALTFSWIYELTPDGLKKEGEVVHDPGRQTSARKMNIVIAVLLVSAIIAVAIDRMIPEPQQSADAGIPAAIPERSIAVLPFVNMSDDPANVYFSEGLSEELLNMLATLQDLHVTARTSSFSFKDKDVDIRTIGQQLNVAHVLEGSVRKFEKQIRITIQLIETENGYHLWSETFDRTLDDIFAVQDEIAAAVVDALRVSILGEGPRARETTPEAFAIYLQASHFYQQRTRDGYEKAEQYTNQVIILDPEYAPGWSLLASILASQALTGQAPFDDAHEQALSAAERALEIDPDYALANSSRAWLAMTYERDYAKSAAYFRRALELAPGNSTIMSNRAVLARTLGHIDEAIELTERCLVLNPVSSINYTNLSDQYYRAGRPNDAAEAARKAIELAPGNTIGAINLAFSYLLGEKPELAIAAVDQVESVFYASLVKALAYHGLGRRTESDDALAVITERFSGSSAYLIAIVHAWRNDSDSAFNWLDRAVNENQPTLGIRTEPFLKNLHDDPRWDALLTSVGLSDEQVAAIDF